MHPFCNTMQKAPKLALLPESPGKQHYTGKAMFVEI